jgi:hypothetical protein
MDDDLDHEQDYPAKARQAEEFAAQSSDIVTRHTWLRIAEGYWNLAKFVHPRSSRGLSWGPSASPQSSSSVFSHRH